MVKENAMKALHILTALSLGLTLSACQGANPFKRNSDPLANYQSEKAYSTPVDVDLLRPVITLDDSAVDGVAYGKSVSFKVDVYDPQSSQSKPPVLSPQAAFHKELYTDDELDGSLAVTDCKPDAKFSLGDGHWQFECTFDSKALTSLGDLVGSDNVAVFGFDLSAQSSSASKLISKTPRKVDMKVLFSKTASADAKGKST
jgi:hypothetical protein